MSTDDFNSLSSYISVLHGYPAIGEPVSNGEIKAITELYRLAKIYHPHLLLDLPVTKFHGAIAEFVPNCPSAEMMKDILEISGEIQSSDALR